MTAEGSKVTDEEIKMFDLEDDDTANQRSDTATESSHTASETDDEPQGENGTVATIVVRC
jgi:hypothetical protein